jgi:hypothetical protein
MKCDNCDSEFKNINVAFYTDGVLISRGLKGIKETILNLLFNRNKNTVLKFSIEFRLGPDGKLYLCNPQLLHEVNDI